MGESFLAQFEIRRPLQRSAEPSVYLAYQRDLERLVSIKFLRQGVLPENEARERFFAEARLLAQLKHQHLVEMLDLVPGDRPYMVLQHVDGWNLHQVLYRRGPLPLRDVFSLILQITAGVSFLHRQGVVHGNLKPANILVDRDGWAKVIDLGFACPVPGVEPLPELLPIFETLGLHPQSDAAGSATARVGTPTHMAPELFRGHRPSPKTDVYALGVILYELLVGHTPFVAPDPEKLCLLHLEVPPPPIRGLTRTIPMELEETVRKALAKSTGRRYPDVDQFRLDLEDLALFAQLWIDDYVPSRYPTQPERFPAWCVTLPVRAVLQEGVQPTSGRPPPEPTQARDSADAVSRPAPPAAGPVLSSPPMAPPASPPAGVTVAPAPTPLPAGPPRPSVPAFLAALIALLIGGAAWETFSPRDRPARLYTGADLVDWHITESPGGLLVNWRTLRPCDTRLWYSRGARAAVEIAGGVAPSLHHQLLVPSGPRTEPGRLWVSLGGERRAGPLRLEPEPAFTLTGPRLVPVPGGVRVILTTNRPSTAKIDVFPSEEAASRSIQAGPVLTAAHSLLVDGLRPGVPYLAQLVATGERGQTLTAGLVLRVPAPRVEVVPVRDRAIGPVLFDGECVLTWDDGLQLARLADGKPLWKASQVPMPGPAPVLRESLLVAASDSGELQALDWETGAFRWKVPVGGRPVGPLATDGDRTYVVTIDGALGAHRLDDGARSWVLDLGGTPAAGPLLMRPGPGPGGASGPLVVALEDGRVSGVDPVLGTELFSTQLKRPVERLAASGRTLVASTRDSIVALDDRGRQLWESTARGAAVGDGEQLAVVDGSVARLLDSRTGTVVWASAVGTEVILPPVLGADAVFVAGSDGTIRALSRRTGRETWSHSGAHTARSLISAGGSLWIADVGGCISRIRNL
ncbi:MAG: PQQ-binding-like beta-propeller repeat protein [Candidatus Riflebacteria bacterium]|nr:PQQ-binding-like beta-propeller repeat protein [Candidatus Riflebacteria bacterium]